MTQDIFDDVIRLFSAKIRDRGVMVRCHVPQGMRMFVIVSQIRQVMAHLLSNAIDAVAANGEVKLDADREDVSLHLTVCDNGTGITPDDTLRLFQPFVSTKGHLGNGLGLYISKEIAERHGGAIQIRSILGKGTTAQVTLPFVDPVG